MNVKAIFIPRTTFYYSLFILLFIYACGDDDTKTGVNFTQQLVINQNPSGFAPLTAMLSFTTEEAYAVELRVVGRNGASSDVITNFPNPTTEHEIMVLGLYGDFQNTVELAFFDSNNLKLGTETINILGLPLIPQLPQITINERDESRMKPGMHFVNYLGHNGNTTPQTPHIFDNFGDIRWFLDYSTSQELGNLITEVGMFRLQNGNLFFGNKDSSFIYEINMLGEIINRWPLNNYTYHHTVIEKANGNLVVTVNDNAKSTIEDVVIELDRESEKIINVWDLTVSLDQMRRTWDTDLANISIDWFHGNGLAWDESDNTLIVSGRTQGLIKLTESNEVVWILAPHKEWNTAGNGTDLNQYLLQPLDSEGQPITNTQIVEGDSNHPDFEWSWYQHSPQLMPNGNVLLFDNGDNRNFSPNEKYSRAVEYDINQSDMTVQQIWEYGKERGTEIYSRIVSRVSFYENENNVLLSCGSASALNGTNYGKVIEVDRATNEVLFEATVIAPETVFIITFHNTEKIELYPV